MSGVHYIDEAGEVSAALVTDFNAMLDRELAALVRSFESELSKPSPIIAAAVAMTAESKADS